MEKNKILEIRAMRRIKGKPCSIIEDTEKRIVREETVRRLKETYSKKYLLEKELVTPGEYRTITGESMFHSQNRRDAEAAQIMHQVVGSEVFSYKK